MNIGSLKGEKSEVLFYYGDSNDNSPFVACGEIGFCPLGSLIKDFPMNTHSIIQNNVNEMRYAEDGGWIMLFDLPGISRKIAAIQSNRGTFYENRHAKQGRPKSVWRDFYYSGTYTILSNINKLWSPQSLEISHLTGTDWVGGLLPTFMDALHNLLDNEEVSFKSIYFNKCCLESEHRITDALLCIENERSNNAKIHREINSETISENKGVHKIRFELGHK